MSETRGATGHSDRTLGTAAGIGLLLIVPTVILAGIAVLSTATASRCLTYGEECSKGVPAGVITALFAVSVLLGILNLVPLREQLSSTAVRGGMLCAQYATLLTGGSMILSHA